MSLIEQAKEFFADAVAEVGAVLAGVEQDEAQIEKARREAQAKHAKVRATLLAELRGRNEAYAAPAPLGEVDANVGQQVGQYAAMGRDGLNMLNMLLGLSGRLSSQEINGRLVTTVDPPRLPFGPNDPVTWGQLCAFAPEEVTAKVAGLMRQLPHPRGTPLAERPALIEQLDRELATLEQKEDALAIKLNVPRRPEMVQRESIAARAAERAEQKRKDAEWLEEQKKAGRLGTPQVHTAQMHPGRRGQA